MSHTITTTTTADTNSTSIDSPVHQQPVRRSFRPWWRWLLVALAFPVAGEIGHLVAGRVDSVSAAVIGGIVTGAGIGAAQWALLRRRGIGVGWIPATAAGLGAGLALGAALVSYRTDISSLAVMGAICGVGVGIAQGAMLGNTQRMLGWGAVTAALWAVGWTVTTAGGINVDEQFVVFGAYGAITSTFLQSTIIGSFIPAEAVQQ
jgi:hypothetical protein